jgi:hypothetical protein
MQQILGNTNRMIKGHDITSLHSTNIYMLVIFPDQILFNISRYIRVKYEKYYFMCEEREIGFIENSMF